MADSPKSIFFNAIGNTGNAATVDFSVSTVQTMTLHPTSGSVVTLTFANPVAGASYLLVLSQDSTGSRTVTWPTIKWKNGVVPVLSTAANAIDAVALIYDGVEYLGSYSLGYA